jgi:hypothetical protein
MVSYLDSTERNIRFTVLVGRSTADADGERICGERKEAGRPGAKSRSVTEDFLNCGGNVASILSFTRRYGPLDEPSGQRQFQFEIANWKEEQARIRFWWEMFAKISTTSSIKSMVIDTRPHDQFRMGKEGLVFECASLLQYMRLEIASLPSERLRTCLREGCGLHFVAHDLKEKYCSGACKRVERNKAKLRYWNQHKAELLAERISRRKAERKKNVTRKTR